MLDIYNVRDESLELLNYSEAKPDLLKLLKSKDSSDLIKINPVHLALFYERRDVIEYFMKKLKINMRKCISHPISESKIEFLVRLSVLKK